MDSYDPTIENTFNKNLKYKGQEYDVLVVDTAGQDEYSIFPTQYSVDIDGYILVYSIDSEQSFEVVQVKYSPFLTYWVVCPNFGHPALTSSFTNISTILS